MPTDSSNDQPLDRILRVLEQVVGRCEPVSISEIAEAAELPMSTVHRLVGQLESRSVLKRAIGSKRILAGPRLVDLGVRILEAAMVADPPHAVLTALAADIGEHCQVGIVADGEVLYIDSARSGRSIGLQFEPGRRSPLYCTSIGKLFLAELAEDKFLAWLDQVTLEPFTATTITDPNVLAAIMRQTRASGWASSNEEYSPGVVGCAVPIRTRNGSLLAGLGISAPAARLAFDRLKSVIPRLKKAAEDIGNALR